MLIVVDKTSPPYCYNAKLIQHYPISIPGVSCLVYSIILPSTWYHSTIIIVVFRGQISPLDGTTFKKQIIDVCVRALEVAAILAMIRHTSAHAAAYFTNVDAKCCNVSRSTTTFALELSCVVHMLRTAQHHETPVIGQLSWGRPRKQ